jgi:hypothetical protein
MWWNTFSIIYIILIILYNAWKIIPKSKPINSNSIHRRLNVSCRYEHNKNGIAGIAQLFRDCTGHLKDNAKLKLNHSKCLNYVLSRNHPGGVFFPKLFRFVILFVKDYREYFGESFVSITPYFTNVQFCSGNPLSVLLRKYKEDAKSEDTMIEYVRLKIPQSANFEDIKCFASEKFGFRIMKFVL